MSDSYPPVPPAPQQPEGFQQPYQGAQPPQYNQASPAQYGQQPYPPQPYQQQPYPSQPYQRQPYGQPQYTPYPPQQFAPQWGQAPAKPKSSGFRIAAGIVGVVLGLFLLLESGPGFRYDAFVALLFLIAALGNITSGILLLVMQSGQGRGAPITAISFAGFALLASLVSTSVPYYGAAPLLIDIILATPVIVLMSLGLSREAKEAAAPSYRGY